MNEENEAVEQSNAEGNGGNDGENSAADSSGDKQDEETSDNNEVPEVLTTAEEASESTTADEENAEEQPQQEQQQVDVVESSEVGESTEDPEKESEDAESVSEETKSGSNRHYLRAPKIKVIPREVILPRENSSSEEDTDDIVPELTPRTERTTRMASSRWWDSEDSVSEADRIDISRDDPRDQILWAAEKNELDMLRQLLATDSSLVSVTDADLYTPLHRASYNNHAEVIKILLAHGASTEARTVDDWQPLHCACKWDCVEAASVLLQSGADVNSRSKGGVTPLHLAASNTSGRRTLELLLWHPYTDPTIINEAGDLAKDLARRSGPFESLFEIVDSSVNVY